MPSDALVGAGFTPELVPLCNTSDLLESGDGVPFDLEYYGRACRGFAVRYRGVAHAYLNRCTHVPVEMDYQPNKFFDITGHYLICATHGAVYSPETGEGRGGPCRGGLVKIALTERDGVVHWHTAPHLKPIAF